MVLNGIRILGYHGGHSAVCWCRLAVDCAMRKQSSDFSSSISMVTQKCTVASSRLAITVEFLEK